jgi:membrane protein
MFHRVAQTLPVRVALHTRRDDATFIAAGVALYLLLGLIPTLSAVVSIYALIADPGEIQRHLAGLDRVIPGEVFELIVGQLQRAASRSSNELGLAAATSVLLAIYSSRASADAVLTAIEHVDGAPPRWTGWRRLVLTLAVAFGSLTALVTLLVVVVAVPATSATLGSSDRSALFTLRWPVLIAIGVGSLSALYALGAPRRPVRLVVPGALAGTAIGLAASLGVSYYVTALAAYRSLYGAFGGVMIVLLWFYVVSLAVVIGAVVNAELASPSSGAPAPSAPSSGSATPSSGA